MVTPYDGSVDETTAIVGRWYSSDSRIRVFRHESNRGVTAAKNTGFDHIQGEWFVMLDSDDEMTPEALAVLLKRLKGQAPQPSPVTASTRARAR